MVKVRQNNPITELWSRTDWSHFDTYQAVTNDTGLGRSGDGGSFNYGLSSQSHINVRTFIEPGGWTGGLSTGYVASLNHWPGATATCTTGLNSFTSQYTTPIDLTAIGPNVQLVLALPNFPLSSIDRTNSWIDLSSDGFVSHIASVRWADSITSPIAEHSGLTWAYSSLNSQTANLAAVTGVRLRITATSNCTVYLMALRLVNNAWVQTNVDFDNLDGQLRQCIPLTGDPTLAPVVNNHTVPVLWRSAQVPGSDDPHPVNAELSFLFNTGSQTSSNSVSLYMRETSQAFMTQLDLQGQTQAALSGKPQPALGISLLAPRTMSDLDHLTVGTMDNQTMGYLEAVNNPVYSSWIRFTVQWGTAPQLQITNSVNPNGGYQFNSGFTFANNTTYLAICNLTETSARLQVYNVNQSTLAIGTPLYDTTLIPDTFMFPRRAGRIGFQAILRDGDSYVGAVRPRGLMFAEYRSSPMASITPVKGARLYVQGSSDIELFSAWSPLADSLGNVPILAPDQQRYVQSHVDHQSTKVTVTAPSNTIPAQGIVSNWLTPAGDNTSGITDFNQLHLEFSLWVPGSALSPTVANLSAVLISSTGASYSLNLPPLIGNQWQSFSIFRPLSQPYPQSGLYQLIIYYLGSVGTTFWVDEVSMHEHSIAWDARSVVDDPWFSNYAPWTTFHDTINSDTSGVYFTTQGAHLQMRAQALKQDAAILSSPKLVPEYAELGRLIWPEDAPPPSVGPTGVITTTNLGRTYTFDATGSTSPNQVGAYLWAFGDGTFGSGSVVQHTYPSWVSSGTDYTVSLTVIDRAGLTGIDTTLVTL